MSIRSLERARLLEITGAAEPTTPSVTIAFALDKEYLEYFKVMLQSMAMRNTLPDCPIAVYSDDPDVFDDPVVRITADKLCLMSGEKKNLIYDLARNNVKRSERSKWNKGTFLKWSVFEPQETDRLLFLDVDMLCIGKLEPLLDLKLEAPFVCCPQFQKTIKENENGPFGSDVIAKSLRDMLDGEFQGRHTWRINSGMMLIGKPLLSHDFFQDLTEYAKTRVAFHEQEHLSNFFRDNPDLRIMVSSAYNFQEMYLDKVSAIDQNEILARVTVLHYAGGAKPWNINPAKMDRPSLSLWHKYRTASMRLLSVR